MPSWVAVFLAGVTGEQFYKEEIEKKINLNENFKLGKYEILFSKLNDVNGPNYLSKSAEFNVYFKDKFIKTIISEKRFYPVERNQTTEAGILNSFLGDIYIVFGKGNLNTGWTVRAYLNPLVSWIWYGVALMALGGFISIIQIIRKKKI